MNRIFSFFSVLFIAVFFAIYMLPSEALAGNRFGAAVGSNYFSGTAEGYIIGTVLPESNASGSACSGYSYGAWEAAGSPSNTSNFAIPYSAVRADGTHAQRRADIYSYLRSTYDAGSLASGSTCLQRQKRIGATFVVKTLLGIQSPTSRSVTAAQWDALQQRLDNPNIRVNSQNRTSSFNSARMHESNTNASRVIDVRHYTMSNSQTEPTIVIVDNSTGETVYELRRRCGNPFGEGDGLPDFDLVTVIGERIATGDLNSSDVENFNVRIRQPDSGGNYNQLANTGTTFTVTNVPSGQVRVTGSNTNGYEQRQRRRICTSTDTSSCGSWSTWTDWRYGVTDQTGTSNVQAGRVVRVQIQYQLLPIDTGVGNSSCFIYEYSVNLSGQLHNAQLQYANSSTGPWQSATGSAFTRTNQSDGDYDFNIGSFRDFGERWFRVEIRQADNTDNVAYTPVRSNGGPCLIASCGTIQTSPTEPEVWTEFDVSLTMRIIDVTSGSTLVLYPNRARPFSATGTLSYSTDGSGSVVIPNNTSTITVNSLTSNTLKWANISSSAYDVNFSASVTGLNPSSFTCGSSTSLSSYPYVSAFGADVIAGNGFLPDMCDINNEGFIRALFDNSRFVGSGAQFAVQAMAQIEGFASAKMRSTGAPQPLKGLTFANTGTAPASTAYGGGFSVTHCVRDWYALASGVDSTDLGNLNSIMNSGTNIGTYSFSAPQLGGPPNINVIQGSRLVVYRDGDLYLNRNIIYESSNAWTDIDDIPSFYFIVSGDIYISSEVEQLDGVYIAQPDGSGSGGNIYTCATGVGSPVNIVDNPDNATQQCGKQLIVNGAFIADTVKFNRAFSSQVSGSRSEFVYDPNKTCRVGVGTAFEGTATKPVCAAEIINFSPEIFLAPSPFQSDSPSVPRGIYDSIISLPPVL